MDTSAASSRPPLLQVKEVAKHFHGVRAVEQASFDLHSGECLGLVGGNGAGKSTLIRVLTGAHKPDGGQVELEGRSLLGLSPAAVLRAGVACIYQELSLVPQLTVRENLLLGQEGAFFPRRREERHRVREVLERLGARCRPEDPLWRLDLATRQQVEIARALLREARVLILDEPTTALTPTEAERLFLVLDELMARGMGILFVSHRLDELFQHTKRLCVMRDGRSLGSWPTRELDRARLIELMAGRPVATEFPPPGDAAPGPVLLEARGLGGGRVRDVSFVLRCGEVLGLAGLAGAGRTELARLLAGVDAVEEGELIFEGRPLALSSPGEALREGLCYLSEDRQREGLFPLLGARENFSLPRLSAWSRGGFIRRGVERHTFQQMVEQLQIRLAGLDQPAAELSGGNQQKVLLARWLACRPRVLILDEPTRGVDAGAKAEIYRLVRTLAGQGLALVLISSETPELLGLCDRLLVLREGRMAGEVTVEGKDTARLLMEMAAA